MVSLRQKRPPSSEERGEKSVAIFEKKKRCKGCTFVAQKTSAYIIFFRPRSHRLMCPYGPLLYEQTIGCSGTVQRDLCSATRNQTFRGGEEKLLFSCANFVDQTKSASSKCSDKDMIVVCVGLILMENPMPTNPPISSSFPKVDFS